MKKNIIVLVVLAIVVLLVFVSGDKLQRSDNSSTDNNSTLAKELITSAVFECDGDKSIQASFYKVEDVPVAQGEMPVPSGEVALTLSDGRMMTLPQTISASGARYATPDESMVFWNKGDTAFITENETETFLNCIILPELPEVVSNTKNQIYQFASERSYVGLAELAGDTIKYTYGENYEGGFVAWLKYLDEKSTKEKIFDYILEILKEPYSKQGNIYIWPAVFAKSAEEWTADDLASMQRFASEEEIEGWRAFGAYIGYRIGIDESGKWVYFISGD